MLGSAAEQCMGGALDGTMDTSCSFGIHSTAEDDGASALAEGGCCDTGAVVPSQDESAIETWGELSKRPFLANVVTRPACFNCTPVEQRLAEMPTEECDAVPSEEESTSTAPEWAAQTDVEHRQSTDFGVREVPKGGSSLFGTTTSTVFKSNSADSGINGWTVELEKALLQERLFPVVDCQASSFKRSWGFSSLGLGGSAKTLRDLKKLFIWMFRWATSSNEPDKMGETEEMENRRRAGEGDH